MSNLEYFSYIFFVFSFYAFAQFSLFTVNHLLITRCNTKSFMDLYISLLKMYRNKFHTCLCFGHLGIFLICLSEALQVLYGRILLATMWTEIGMSFVFWGYTSYQYHRLHSLSINEKFEKVLKILVKVVEVGSILLSVCWIIGFWSSVEDVIGELLRAGIGLIVIILDFIFLYLYYQYYHSTTISNTATTTSSTTSPNSTTAIISTYGLLCTITNLSSFFLFILLIVKTDDPVLSQWVLVGISCLLLMTGLWMVMMKIRLVGLRLQKEHDGLVWLNTRRHDFVLHSIGIKDSPASIHSANHTSSIVSPPITTTINTPTLYDIKESIEEEAEEIDSV